MKLASLLVILASSLAFCQDAAIPHLARQGTATQLIVDGKPFLMLAAELHNSSSSNLDYMHPVWPRLAEIPLNTVLTPVSWELIEPTEGKFDFALVDGLIQQAKEHNLRLVFLWLASWKNGMSSYAPVWVKQDTKRFPRVLTRNGNEIEILSTFGEETAKADARAFAALMRHIREVDQAHTVLMMQVENEVGVLGDSRDHSALANKQFSSGVAAALTDYLRKHRDTLNPSLRSTWEAAGAKTAGTWQQVFGSGLRADEIFMAWNYSRYVNRVAAAGKHEYALPMYVNAWLAGAGAPPGDYPSGGPQPGVIDVWKAAGDAIDIYSPDIYQPNLSEWCDRYHRPDNPLFIPETSGGALGQANAFYAIGQHDAMGFSPFGIDSWTDHDNNLGKSYRVLSELAPLIIQHQGKQEMGGFLLDKEHPSTFLELNGCHLRVTLDEIFGGKAEKGYGLIIATAPNEFVGAGSGFRVSFAPATDPTAHTGVGYVEEGAWKDQAWVPGRRLNGDENDQGSYWRFSPQAVHVEKAVIYRY